MIEIKFACGCPPLRANDKIKTAICECGESRIVRVNAPTPRFRGACQGPHAEHKALPAIDVSAYMKGSEDNG